MLKGRVWTTKKKKKKKKRQNPKVDFFSHKAVFLRAGHIICGKIKKYNYLVIWFDYTNDVQLWKLQIFLPKNWFTLFASFTFIRGNVQKVLFFVIFISIANVNSGFISFNLANILVLKMLALLICLFSILLNVSCTI